MTEQNKLTIEAGEGKRPMSMKIDKFWRVSFKQLENYDRIAKEIAAFKRSQRTRERLTR